MNTFVDVMEKFNNIKSTENGAVAYKSTNSKVYDLFAFGGAYRNRNDFDIVKLFYDAYVEDPTLALKCLFYLRDVRGGQGERRFFRIAFNWLCEYDRVAAERNLLNVAEYGRWDDLIYTTYNTPVWHRTVAIVSEQLILDIESRTPSLLGKWMPSENASSYNTRMMAGQLRKALELTPKQYRKMLSALRKRINIVETLMSENRWDEIEFDKIPSKAGLVYKNAFARRDIIAKKYEAFVKSDKTTVNASALYPYEVVRKATEHCNGWGRSRSLSSIDRAAINKYWENLPDYFDGTECNLMCVVDTSASMTWSNAGQVLPIDVAISLGLYTAERLRGPFHNNYISFSRRPTLVKTEGYDFVDKVERIYHTNLCENTDLPAVFDLLYSIANAYNCADELPETIVIISDMEIDAGCGYGWRRDFNAVSTMEQIRKKWDASGLKMPKLVYWNVNARNNTILDLSKDVSCVSGCSPTIFKQVITGKTGTDLMLEILMAERYAAVR